MTNRSSGWRGRLALLFTVLAVLAVGAVLPQQASAVPPGGNATTDDRMTSVPGSWRTYRSVSPAYLGSTALQGGYRIVDLEVDASAPYAFTARLVHNAGSYAAPGGWWWYYGKTLAQVNTLLSTNQARLIDIEGYPTAAGTRYAVVMVRNTGVAYRQSYYRTGTNATTLYNELIQKGFRPQQVGAFYQGATKIYTLIAVKNSGADARTWQWKINRTQAQVGADLTSFKGRLINLERVSATLHDTLMFKESASFWLWYTGLTGTQVNEVAVQTGTRPIDIERYVTAAGSRYNVVYLDNLDGPDGKARSAMWKRYGSFNQWGFYLKRVNGSTLSSLGAVQQFEPASAIKVLVHLHANLKLQQGQAVTTQVLNYKRQDRPDWQNSCPDSSTISGTAQLGTMDKEMMTVSNNPYTHALRQRFGTANIEATGQSIGLTATKFNHNIGCGTFKTQPNRTTLTDLGRVYERVELGTALNATYRNRFLTNMNGGKGTGTWFCDVVKQEAASLGKTAAFATSYCDQLRYFNKGGSYGSGGKSWLTTAGLVRLPVKGGAIRSFVYGSYLQNIGLNPGETKEQMDAPRTAAAKEMFRPEIRAALQTY